jgi:hypothetical protein
VKDFTTEGRNHEKNEKMNITNNYVDPGVKNEITIWQTAENTEKIISDYGYMCELSG